MDVWLYEGVGGGDCGGCEGMDGFGHFGLYLRLIVGDLLVMDCLMFRIEDGDGGER